jgi:hypothetical protein
LKHRYDSLASAVALCVLAGGVACNRVTSPSPVTASSPVAPPVIAPPTPSITVSGTVWVHGANGTTSPAGGRVSGWIQLDRSGSSIGWVPVDAAGRYSVSAPLGSLVRVYAGDTAYQPCEMLEPNLRAAVIRDIHLVADPSQLGGRLPMELLRDTPTLSGVVFEMTSAGRRPLSDVELELDGLYGIGVVTARTRTDSEGRYLFCGLGGETSTYLFAFRGGYRGFEGTVQLNGTTDTTFDIELGRIGSRE